MSLRIIAVIVSFGTCALCQAEAEPSAAAPKKIAMFQLRGPLVEMPRGLTLSLLDETHGTLRELLGRFDKAGKDKDLAGVILLLEEPVLGWAQIQEVRAAIARLRSAGKEVHCHLASSGAGGYMLAAACNRISMVPGGGLDIVGISAEEIYLKGLLDKLGIVADIRHCGAYKGAGEPLTRTGPSKEAAEQMNRLLGDFYDQMIETIAESRKLRPDEARALIDKGPLTARQAAAGNLVDDLSYRHEFMMNVQRKWQGAELAKRYGREKSPELDLASPFAFFKLFSEMMKPTAKKAKNTIALVYVDGMITTGRSSETLWGDIIVGSSTLRSALLKAAGDGDVKAVVLRVDSPGGSALASDIISEATQVVRKAGKPLVVSMGNIAASGGYYVSARAETIFAEAGTLTGSIGVVGGKIALGGLFEKIGISTHTYKRGRNADLFNMTRPFDEGQQKVVQDLMDDVYGQFKRIVVSGRGDRLKGDIDELAGGRVYTGRQALAKGLVDKLGGLDDAVRDAAERAKLTDYTVRVMPKAKTLFDYINDAFGFQDEDEDVSSASEMMLMRRMASESPLAGLLPVIRELAPDQARAVARMLLRISMLRRESVLAVTPNEWVIR
ncbi:MAG: signal peptide peptidase SppA [Phycisphaerae bacterium]|nr:signal peptide peptidase SppA [Phycisphaerae bacterium]